MDDLIPRHFSLSLSLSLSLFDWRFEFVITGRIWYLKVIEFICGKELEI
jgi:hypothetical protein